MLKLYSCAEINIWNAPLREPVEDLFTIGMLLEKLLIKVLKEEESFSGKRPFGYSGWLNNIYDSMPLELTEKQKLDVLVSLIRKKLKK